jgi:hypothetical protein
MRPRASAFSTVAAHVAQALVPAGSTLMSSLAAHSVVLILVFAAAAAAQTGFPFTDESLHYNINWPSGLSLGEATFTSHKTAAGFTLEATADAAVPGFAIADRFRSSATPDVCSLEFTRETSHGSKKTREKTTFDSAKGTARRVTTLPENGGVTDFDISSCARDALAFVYFVRREMGQGRVAPPATVYFGSAYSVRVDYTGAMTIPSDGRQTVTDHVNVSIRGPKANIVVEVFFARDAARTPLLIRVPVAVGNLSLELVR